MEGIAEKSATCMQMMPKSDEKHTRVTIIETNKKYEHQVSVVGCSAVEEKFRRQNKETINDVSFRQKWRLGT